MTLIGSLVGWIWLSALVATAPAAPDGLSTGEILDRLQAEADAIERLQLRARPLEPRLDDPCEAAATISHMRPCLAGQPCAARELWEKRFGSPSLDLAAPGRQAQRILITSPCMARR